MTKLVQKRTIAQKRDRRVHRAKNSNMPARPRLNRTKRVIQNQITAKPTPSGVNTGIMALNHWASISPLAQMSLAFMAPGTVNAPFVECNGTPSRVPTTIVHGEFEFVPSLLQLAEYFVIFNAPLLGYNLDKGTTGIYSESRPNGTLPFTVAMGLGTSFTNLYGASDVLSRYKILAQRLELSFSAPEATVSGMVHVGSIQTSVLNGATIVNLLDNATESFDLKTNKIVSLRSFISDRSLVHEPASLSSVADEWISYAVYSKKAASSITDGSAISWKIIAKAHSNILWNPVSTSSVMNGIAMRTPDSYAPPPPIQIELSNTIQSRAAEPTSAHINTVSKIVSALVKGASVIAHLSPWTRGLSLGVNAIAAMLQDPRQSIPDYSDQINNLESLCSRVRTTTTYDEEDASAVDSLLDAFAVLLQYFRNKQQECIAIKARYDSCVAEVSTTRKGSLVRYKDPLGSFYDHREIQPENRSKSLAKRAIARPAEIDTEYKSEANDSFRYR